MRLPSFRTLLRGHFLAGLLVVIPFAVIAWILLGALGMIWGLHSMLPNAWRPESPIVEFLVNLGFTVVAALLLALSISIVGWTSKQFLGRKILQLLAEAINRIPIIRSIYGALDQLLRTMAPGGGKQFSRVVYVEYPRAGLWVIAFVTGPARSPVGGDERCLNLYVPTTPNPTSGFHLIVPEAQVRETGLSVEEAFKVILSLGIAGSTGRRED
jgi:uncharacterized membrane protein